MKTSDIRISISGPQKSGKTSLMKALNKAIQEKATVGLETTFRPTEQFKLSWELGNTEEWVLKDTSLPQQPVPLGPNRTRDGREAEVIAVGVKMRNGSGVVALVDTRDRLFKETVCLYGDGRLGPNYEDPGDLVGHLPPEPPKPREIWLCEELNGDDQVVWDTEQTNIAHGRKQTLFREVIE